MIDNQTTNNNMAQHNELGKQGEQIARKYLEQKGYEILETNWHYSHAEIDIIARKGDVLAVIEVKTRTSDHYGKPETFVNKKKINHLKNAVNYYVRTNKLDVEIRFDIISIIKNQYVEKVEHLENAFLWF